MDRERIDEHTYEGTAGDVIGTAKGKQYGSALNWSYVLRVPVGSSTSDLTFDDWMFLGPQGTLINRAVMKKYGIKVGELVLAFERESPSDVPLARPHTLSTGLKIHPVAVGSRFIYSTRVASVHHCLDDCACPSSSKTAAAQRYAGPVTKGPLEARAMFAPPSRSGCCRCIPRAISPARRHPLILESP